MNNQQTQSYIREVSTQVAMALTSSKTPDAVKDCLKTIIFEASSEADLTVSDFSLIADALPNVIEKLPVDYGRGFLHSIAAIIRHDTGAFREFYEQRLDKESITRATAEPKQTTENDMKNEKELNRAEIITHDEIERLIYLLVADEEFAPYAIYGLMFLFGSIKKLFEADNKYDIESLFTIALIKLYSISDNVYEAVNRTTRDIHIHYRTADFKCDDYHAVVKPFVESELSATDEKPSAIVSDLPKQPFEAEDESLNDLANQFAAIMNNPNLPTDIYNVLTDEFARIPVSTGTPENILLNLKALSDAEKKQQEAKNA